MSRNVDNQSQKNRYKLIRSMTTLSIHMKGHNKRKDVVIIATYRHCLS